MTMAKQKTRVGGGPARASGKDSSVTAGLEHSLNRSEEQVLHFVPTPKSKAPSWIKKPGKRNTIEPVERVVRWRWPTERKAQYAAFDAWFDIAMQIIDRAHKPFRLVAVYRAAMFWNSGEICFSDAILAEMAGRCSPRTISREVSLHRALGLIEIEHGWRIADGRRVKTRIIRLAVPDPFPAFVKVEDTDTRVSTSIIPPSRHTGGETVTTHGCLITLELKEEDGNDATA